MTRQGEAESRGRLIPLALWGILLVTVSWWALALWPSPDVPPAWLARTRQVCFNTGPSGLPGPSGWMLLIGQPIGMFALLMAVAGGGVRETLQRAAGSGRGRLGLGLAGLVVVAGLTLAGVRVRQAVPDGVWLADAAEVVPESYPRLDRTPPLLGLVNQAGDTVHWSQFAGSKVIVTFGFGHCETICPLMVHNANRVQDILRAEGEEVPVVVITLDPWRDTPSRLPHLADQFMLGPGSHILSGTVQDVNRVLDGLNMARERDLQTGDIVHPSLVYLLDETGVIAYGATGHAPLIEELLRRM